MISPDPYSQSFSHQLFTSSSVLKSFEKPTALAIDRGRRSTGSADGDIQIKDLTTHQTIPPHREPKTNRLWRLPLIMRGHSLLVIAMARSKPGI